MRIWVALDVPSVSGAENVLTAIEPHRDVKIGMELFYRAGPGYVEELVKRGYSLFLDLKCHDIPRTVGRALAALRDLGVEMVTLHTQGGLEMLRQARQEAGSIQLLGVTALTSLSDTDLHDVGISGTIGEFVTASAQVAQRAGLAGVVCSGGEVAELSRLWPGARFLVPGIRLPDDQIGDQKRVFSPSAAQAAGATDIVVGRAVVGAENPARVLQRYWENLTTNVGGLNERPI